MKNKIIPFVLLSLFIVGYSFISSSNSELDEFNQEDADNEYVSSLKKTVTKEKIEKAKYISDIIPDYPMQWNEIINYVSTEITTINEGKAILSSGTSYSLNAEQKNSLNSVDFGSEMEIKIKFMYKDPANDNVGSNRKIKEMEFIIKAVPNKEAEFPGGSKKITEYFTENVIKKIAESGYSVNDSPAIVAYTIDETGKVINPKLVRSSSNSLLNNLLLETVNKMPTWKPAENAKGTKVKEEFKISIPFYFRNGC